VRVITKKPGGQWFSETACRFCWGGKDIIHRIFELYNCWM